MGQEIHTEVYHPADFQRFQQRLAIETKLLEQLITKGACSEHGPVAGFEIEAWLLNDDMRPAPCNASYLLSFNNPLAGTELSKFNVEFNTSPVPLSGNALIELNNDLLATWQQAEQHARQMQLHLLMIGTLPTLRQDDLHLGNMSDMNRYRALNEQILKTRNKPIHLDIKGHEHLKADHHDVMLEAAWFLVATAARVLAAAFPSLGIGFVGVSLAFGLTVLTMAYAIGHISGCHLNPAVSVGLWAGGRFPASKLAPYIVAQVLGAIVAAAVLYAIASGTAGFDVSKGFASNGYGAHSPGGYSLWAALVCEVVMIMFFLIIILGAIDKRAPAGFAPIAIGLGLTLIHLINIPVTNTSVNPARSTGVAFFVGDWAVDQLWLFWVAPIVGALLGATAYRLIGSSED